jgi:hypothetical protein
VDTGSSTTVLAVVEADPFVSIAFRLVVPPLSKNPHPISVTNHQIQVCPCGQPVRPNIGGVRAGRTGNQAQSSVMEAIEGAIKSRSAIPEMLAGLSHASATREELQGAEARIAELETKLDALLQQLTPVPEPADSKPAKPGKATK